jgi:hypothetical protein
MCRELFGYDVAIDYKGDEDLDAALTRSPCRFLIIMMSNIANRCLDLGDLLGDADADRLADSLHGW